MTLVEDLNILEGKQRSAAREREGQFWKEQREVTLDFVGLIKSYEERSSLLSKRIETGTSLIELITPAFEEAHAEYKKRVFSSNFTSEKYNKVRKDLVDNLIGESESRSLPIFKQGILSLPSSDKSPRQNNIIGLIYVIGGTIAGFVAEEKMSLPRGSMASYAALVCSGLTFYAGYSKMQSDKNTLNLRKNCQIFLTGAHRKIKEITYIGLQGNQHNFIVDLRRIDEAVKKYLGK